MENPDDKRKIDNPELNQDATFDKKSEEDFDESDDFHKNDDTSSDTDEESEVSSDSTDAPVVNSDKSDPLRDDGKFDGTIAI